jgi:hypothetical protein
MNLKDALEELDEFNEDLTYANEPMLRVSPISETQERLVYASTNKNGFRQFLQVGTDKPICPECFKLLGMLNEGQGDTCPSCRENYLDDIDWFSTGMTELTTNSYGHPQYVIDGDDVCAECQCCHINFGQGTICHVCESNALLEMSHDWDM